MRDFSNDHRWLSINTQTVDKQGDLFAIVDAIARAGIRGDGREALILFDRCPVRGRRRLFIGHQTKRPGTFVPGRFATRVRYRGSETIVDAATNDAGRE